MKRFMVTRCGGFDFEDSLQTTPSFAPESASYRDWDIADMAEAARGYQGMRSVFVLRR